MADYINTVDTLGFWKFSKSGDQWKYNSIVNSVLDLNSTESISTNNSANPMQIITGEDEPNPNNTLGKTIYKSRGRSIVIEEGYGIWSNIGKNGEFITTEFWFYPKRGNNSSNPEDIDNIIISNSENTAYTDSIWKYSSPQIFSYTPVINTGNNFKNIYFTKKGASGYISTNTSIYYINPIWLYLGYCCYKKSFILYGYSNYCYIDNSTTRYSVNLKTSEKKSFIYTSNNFPPDRWYHIAIVQTKTNNNAQAILFINGKKIGTLTFTGNNSYRALGSPIDSYGLTCHSSPSFVFNNDIDYHIRIGNRIGTNTSNGDIINYTPYKPSIYYWKQPGFQDVIIDDLRITRGVLYTNDFIPPGFAGYQLLYVDNKVYGYNTTNQFVLMDNNWDTKTATQKKSSVNSIGMVDITLDDIKSVVTPTNSNIHLEVYDLSSGKHNAQLFAN